MILQISKSLADKITTGKYNFWSLIVKIILLVSAFALSAQISNKTQYFFHNSLS